MGLRAGAAIADARIPTTAGSPLPAALKRGDLSPAGRGEQAAKRCPS